MGCFDRITILRQPLLIHSGGTPFSSGGTPFSSGRTPLSGGRASTDGAASVRSDFQHHQMALLQVDLSSEQIKESSIKRPGLLVAVIPHGPSPRFPVSYLLNEEIQEIGFFSFLYI